jgi:hypothetical protein
MNMAISQRKKFIYTSFFLVLFIISLVFNSFIFDCNFQITQSNNNNTNALDELPKMSSPAINITTPENKTYKEPMSGYYLSTYGFESDSLGPWTIREPPFANMGNPINIEIVGNFKSHKNVAKFEDRSDSNRTDLIYEVSSSDQNDGTIEFWWATNDTSKYGWHVFDLYRGIAPYSIGYMELNGGRFHIKSGTSTFIDHPVIPQNNVWYHIRIDWSRYGGYQGLSARRYKVTINNVESSQLVFNNDNDVGMRYLRFTSDTEEKDYKWYIDAIGIWSDDNYDLGDNLNEGLLLSFENGPSFNWFAYSLDGQENITIIGNTIISMPNEGLHTIQVFGNIPLGGISESDIRYFIIKFPPINIITPENITYTEPMSGYYPATYGFENDEVGTYPQGWNITRNPSITNEIIAELDGHKNVFHMDKGDTYGISNNALQYFDEVQEYGTIEFWARTTNMLEESSWHLKSGGTNQFAIAGIRIYESSFEYWLGSTDWQEVAYTAVNNQWYHIKIQFKCGTGTHYGLSQYYWRFYVNNEEFGDYAFISSHSNVSHIYIHQNWRYSNYHTYTDAIGYSWDHNYQIGDNQHEGLLLSYTNTTKIESIGYVLDGQINNSINGNTVIPLTGNGIHNIRIYGKNASGIMVESPLRYFTIAISAPQIIINMPYSGENFGMGAPYFEISITSPILDTTGYTLNNGSLIKFIGLFGIIDQVEWNSIRPGYVVIRFWVNDTFGQISFSEVTVIKDLPTPLPRSYDFLIVFIILIAIGFTIINIIVIRKVRRTRTASEILNFRSERIVEAQHLKCPFCRKEIKASHSYCIHCGSKLK